MKFTLLENIAKIYKSIFTYAFAYNPDSSYVYILTPCLYIIDNNSPVWQPIIFMCLHF